MRLRGLALPLRYTVYAAGVLLVFLAAVGLGAAASLLNDWPPERAQTDFGLPTGPETLGETTIETDEGAEGTSLEGPVEKTPFVHTATDDNSRGDYTYLSDPAINGDSNAVILVAVPADREDAGGASYNHNIGVWFEPEKRKWAVFNQDRTVVPAGAAFRVIVPPNSERFVHRAGLVNIVDNTTYLDHPLTNSKPDAVLSVTQNWNPGGGGGVYNDHPVYAFYDEDVDQWAVYNRDGAPMPAGASFNVAVRDGDV